VISGIVLAAGRSSRMGSSKARLILDGEPWVARLVRVFREAELHPIVVVGAPELAALTDARVVAGDPAEMIGSLAHGIEALPDSTDAVVVQPVDAPFTSVEAIRALTADPSRLSVLSHGGEPGHPVLVPRSLFTAVRARPQGGLRTLLAQAVQVEWDRSVLADLDTPEDLVRWKVQ
jgi:molybdenum cofactor cytidylyltransferase